jgi:hypothetical protein
MQWYAGSPHRCDGWAGVLEVSSTAVVMVRCCGSGSATQLKQCSGPWPSGKGRRVRDTRGENHARLEPAMPVLAGFMSFHGGIAEECRHLPIPLGVVPPIENRDGSVWSMMAASWASCLP